MVEQGLVEARDGKKREKFAEQITKSKLKSAKKVEDDEVEKLEGCAGVETS